MKNILVITGSPRQLGNTAILADAFIQGAKAAGHKTEIFDTPFHPVQPCLACNQCWTKDTPCVFKDGLELLAPKLENADVLVLCTPLYWFNMSAQLKAVVDKLYAYMSPKAKHKLKIKEAVLLACAEGKEEDGDYDGLKATYKSICDYLGWKDRGRLLAGACGEKGSIINTPYLKQALELGKTI